MLPNDKISPIFSRIVHKLGTGEQNMSMAANIKLFLLNLKNLKLEMRNLNPKIKSLTQFEVSFIN